MYIGDKASRFYYMGTWGSNIKLHMKIEDIYHRRFDFWGLMGTREYAPEFSIIMDMTLHILSTYESTILVHMPTSRFDIHEKL